LKSVAEKSAVTVLDTFNEDVSVIVHEISSVHALGLSAFQNLIDSGVGITGITKTALIGDPVITFFDHLGAEVATFDRGQVNLLVKVPKIDDWLYDSGG
jgi:hypothetical protein